MNERIEHPLKSSNGLEAYISSGTPNKSIARVVLNACNLERRKVRALKQERNQYRHQANEAHIKVLEAEAATQQAMAHAARSRLESMQDPLIEGCWNLRGLEDAKEQYFHPGLTDNEIGIVYVDLNNLKYVNDNFGHDAGDELLIKTYSYLLRHTKKGVDIVARKGGDEFVVLCRNVSGSPDFEDNLLMGLTERMGDLQIELAQTYEGDDGLSFSVGVAVFDPKLDTDLSDTQTRADLLMKINKDHIKSKREKTQVE